MSKDEDKEGAFVVAPEKIRARVAKLVNELGLAEARKKLGIGESALLRITSGFSVRRGTIALVEQGLETK